MSATPIQESGPEDEDDLPGDDELLFLPLGGAGEIGMNLNLYGHDGAWVIMDLGVSFGDDTTPGVDVFMADPRYIIDRREALAGIVLTHGHEDHLGAVAYLWPTLRCPVYATPFTAALLRRKLSEAGLLTQVPLVEVPLSGRFTVGPFDLELISITHSIPEPNAVAIRTKLGTVLHTGDWKLDPEPLVGPTTDEAALRRLGEEGVLAMVCDSTNALRDGESGSEGSVRDSLRDLLARFDRRIAVTSFASNVARLTTLFEIAEELDRSPVLVGRSMRRMAEVAEETGYLTLPRMLVDEREAGFLPRDKVMLICTGSQGEPRAALSRIAADDHPGIMMEEGDVVVFSSRMIPGNEKAIGRLQNRLVQKGIGIVTERDAFVHVSGHPARDELSRMYQWVRPRIAIPVHGELRHMLAHVELARACQVAHPILVENGAMVQLAPDPPEIVDEIPTGRLAVEGNRLVPMDGIVLRERRRLAYNGSSVATVVVDTMGRLLAEPVVTVHGVLDREHESDLHDLAVEAVREAVEGLPKRSRSDDGAVEDRVRRALRRAVHEGVGKKPLIDVHVVRVA